MKEPICTSCKKREGVYFRMTMNVRVDAWCGICVGKISWNRASRSRTITEEEYLMYLVMES